jgi:imidazolonepropionase-like amidohydrolase
VRAGTIVDPVSGSGRVGDVLVERMRIASLRPGGVPGSRALDARGKFLVPGLWDMHAHLDALNPVGRKPEGYVGHGVLGVRDMGGHIDALRGLRRELAGGRIGPALVMAGPTLNGQAFADFHRIVATEAEGRAAVRALRARGVDLIKVHRAVTPPVFMAILDEARRHGLPVAGHVPLGVGWAEAAEAGMQCIEHVQTMVENVVADRRRPIADVQAAVAYLEGAGGDAIFAAMARNRTYFDPTLIFYESTIAAAAPELAGRRRALYARLKRLVGRAAAAGVRIVTGTDFVNRPGAALLDELERLVQAGLSPPAALRAATSTAAFAARRPQLARIAVGAPASFLILDADPRVDIGNLRRLSAVVLRGRLIDAAGLARLRALDG